VPQFEVLYWNLLGGTENNNETPEICVFTKFNEKFSPDWFIGSLAVSLSRFMVYRMQ
jgi:hypothetical protein